jgi:hypothetical protein
MSSFWCVYGMLSLALAGLFLSTFGPKLNDWYFYGWKKALGMTLLILGFSWLFPPIVTGIVIYLIGFWLFQSFKEWKR